MAARQHLRVIVVDPLPVVRTSVALLIDGQSDMDVVAQARGIDDALFAIGRDHRGRLVVLVDLGFEGDESAHTLIRTIRERFPEHCVVACGARIDAVSIALALFSGAEAFLDKGSDPEEFLRSLRAGATGQMALAGTPTEWVGAIAEGIERRRVVETTLTARERDVLQAAAAGLTARQIATRLGMSERTVTTHLSRIYAKLGVGTRIAAVRLATRAGLVSVSTSE
jgi:DNA-binding NarL/FixJ family response regulator